MNTNDLAWLAGLLEGEGSFCCGVPSKPNQPFIAVQMTDEDVIHRVAKLFGTSLYRGLKRKEWYKPMFSARLRGKRAVDLMRQLQPLMGMRRKAQVCVAIASYRGDLRRSLSNETIREIKNLLIKHVSQWTISRMLMVNRSSVAMIAAGKRHVRED